MNVTIISVVVIVAIIFAIYVFRQSMLTYSLPIDIGLLIIVVALLVWVSKT